MKKRYLLLAATAICAVATYFYIGQEETQYMGEDDVQAYSKSDLLKGLKSPTKKKNLYHEVKHNRPRESTLGYSITPPPGEDWYEKLEKDSLYYLKISESHTRYSILTEAREVHLSKDLTQSKDLLSYVKNQKEKSLVSSKITKPRVTVKMEQSLAQNCVRYSQSYQDHGMKGLSGKRYVNVDTQGLFCLHPDNARVGIDMSYVEKSLSDAEVKSYSNEGEMFLASLNFQKIR